MNKYIIFIINIFSIFLLICFCQRTARFEELNNNQHKTSIQIAFFGVECLRSDQASCTNTQIKLKLKTKSGTIMSPERIIEHSSMSDNEPFIWGVIDDIQEDLELYQEDKCILLNILNPNAIYYDEKFYMTDCDNKVRYKIRIRAYPLLSWYGTFSAKLSFVDVSSPTSSEIYEQSLKYMPSDTSDREDNLYASYISVSENELVKFPDIVRRCYDIAKCIEEMRNDFGFKFSDNREMEQNDEIWNKYSEFTATVTLDDSKTATLKITNYSPDQYSTRSCPVNPCQNQGLCIRYEGPEVSGQPYPSFKCKCQYGYTGDLCELRSKCINCVGECYDNGKCTKCRIGWTGLRCTQPSCKGVEGMCLNNAMCIDSETDIAKCDCSYEFSGRYCERGARSAESSKMLGTSLGISMPIVMIIVAVAIVFFLKSRSY